MVGSEAKEMLLALLKCQSHKELTEKTLLCNKFWSRGSFHSSIKEALAEQSKSQQEKLWSALGDSFSKHMQFYLNPESLDDEQADVAGLTNSPSDVRCQATPGSSVTPAADQSSKDDHAKSKAFLLLTLRLMLTYVQSFPSSKEDESLKVTAAVPMSFIKIVLVVGGVLEVVQDQMCSIAVLLCEEWMLRDLPHSLTFAPQLFTVLVRLSIEKKAEKSYVKRVYRLRDVLPTCLEDQGEAATERPTRSTNTEDLVTALAACTVSPVYLACDSGVKFIGLVLAHKRCMAACHRCVKEFLPRCSKTQANRLGQACCRAWRAVDAPHRKSFEEDCLQDLMYGYVTVHPVNSAQLSSNLVAFLHPLHTHQKLPAFSTVLQRLYYPFLWRSLTCANALMRSNATNALCSAYPLEDLARPMEERDLHLTRCHTALTEALTDDHPSVRIVAVQGVCRIMHSYWATLPKNVIQSWFGLLLTRLAYDASSAQVRQQVIKGLYRVLECQDALPFLQQCLPQLGPCFDDCNAAVRLALVRMLLKLQKLRLIKYWNIVSVSHLLHRLTVDTTSVAKLITQLVAPVFLPIQKDNEDLLERSISLLMENRAASRVFYEHVSLGLDVASVVRVMLVLYQALRRHLLLRHQRLNASGSKQPSGKRLRCSSTNNKENTNEDSNSIEGETQAPRESNVPKNCRRSKNSNSTRNKSSASNASTSSGKKQSASKRSQTPLKAAPGGSGTAGSLSSSGSMDNVPLQRSGSMEELSSQNSSTVDECSSSVEDDHPQYSPFDDLSIVGGTLDALVILWTCNATKISLPHNAKWLVVLQRKVGRGLPLLCSSYRGEGELSRTILQLASFLPRSLVPTLVGHCLSRVRTIDEKAALDLPFDLERFPCMIYVSALCNWNRLDDLLDLIHDWLSAGFDSVAVEPQQEEVTRQANSSSRRSSHNNSCTGRNSKKDSKAGKSRGVRFASPALGEKTSEPKPLAAVAVLRAILHHRLNRNALVVNNRHLLLRLLPTLGRVQRCIELRFEGQADTHLCSDQLLLSCWEDWLCVTALLHHMTSSLPTQDKSARKSASRRRTRDDESTASAEAEEIIEDFDASMRFLDCIRWTARFVLPSMVTKTPANERSNTLDLDLSISVNEIAAVSSTPSNAASKVCGTSDGTPKTRTRKRKLSPQDNLVECSKEQASCSSNDTGSLAASLVSALLRMTAGVVATRTGTPALVSSATKFGCDALEKDSGLELVSACLTLAASCHRYMKVYGTQYAEYAQQTQPEGRQNFLQGTSLLPTNRPQFSVWHPDMSLFKACFASALRCLSSEDMASLSRALNNTLSALDGTGLSEVMQFCLRSCVALISLNQFKSAEEVSQSSTGALLGTLTTRASLARTTAAALRRVCGSSSRESADHQTALMVLLDYLQLHPGKVTERELNVALSVIDLELRNRSRTTRTTPVVLQQRQRGEALTESSSNMSSDCIEDEVSHPQKNSPEGRDTAGGHNKENISSSSNDSSSSLAA